MCGYRCAVVGEVLFRELAAGIRFPPRDDIMILVLVHFQQGEDKQRTFGYYQID